MDSARVNAPVKMGSQFDSSSEQIIKHINAIIPYFPSATAPYDLAQIKHTSTAN